MLGSLFAANRTTVFDAEAWVRDLICSGLFGLVMTIPVVRFFRSPGRLFRAGLLGWAIFVLSYSCATLYYVNLTNRLGKSSFHMLVLGATIYGVLSVGIWVVVTALALIRPEEAHHPSPVRVSDRISSRISPPNR
jgi:hypothetical protein